MIVAAGTFTTTSRPEPPFAVEAGVMLGRMEIDKVFHGQLEGTGSVHMTYVRTPVETSAGYVAVETISGVLDGREGSFVVLHVGLSERSESKLEVSIVPDAGTDQLAGITGSMVISEDLDGHQYTLNYRLPG